MAATNNGSTRSHTRGWLAWREGSELCTVEKGAGQHADNTCCFVGVRGFQYKGIFDHLGSEHHVVTEIHVAGDSEMYTKGHDRILDGEAPKTEQLEAYQ